jgi:hypothetical protein
MATLPEVRRLSTDWICFIVALALVVAVRVGWLGPVPW